MQSTHIECFQLNKSYDGNSPLFSLFNPVKTPGKVALVCSKIGKNSIGGQVAKTLAFEHLTSNILNIYNENLKNILDKDTPGPKINTISILEEAFKITNTSVYNFGHKLAAGGKLGASLLGMLINEDTVSVGRVNAGSVYLIRNKNIFPFFNNTQIEARNQLDKESEVSENVDNENLDKKENLFFNNQTILDNNQHTNNYNNENFIGTNSTVSVEFASVKIGQGDIIIVSSIQLSSPQEFTLINTLKDFIYNEELKIEDYGNFLYNYLLQNQVEPFSVFAIYIGPEVFYLSPSLHFAERIM